MPRPKNSPNKNKRGLKAELKRAYGDDFDVIMMMAENCKTLHEIAKAHVQTGPEGQRLVTVGDDGLIDASSSAKTAIDSLDKLAQYVEPKLKAVEMQHDVSDRLTDLLDELDGDDIGLPDGDS